MRGWVVGVIVAAAVGYVATVATAPAGSGHDPFDSPVLLPALAVLAVLCGVASWFHPRGGPWWGVLVAVVYLAGVFLQLAFQSGDDASFAALGVAILLVLLLVPWLAGLVTGLVRRR